MNFRHYPYLITIGILLILLLRSEVQADQDRNPLKNIESSLDDIAKALERIDRKLK